MTSNLRSALTALIVLALAGVASPARAGFVYTNFKFPDSPGGSTVNGINNNGAVVGFGVNGAGADINYVRNPDGSFTALTTVNNTSTTAMANGLNDSNQVVGTTNGMAFVLTNNYNTLTFLPNVNGTTTSEVAFGINNAGTIVGQYSDSATGRSPGFIYAGGKFTTLDQPQISGALVVNAQSINNNGLVTGFYATVTSPVVGGNTMQHGFFFDTTTNKFTFPADPNPPLLPGTTFFTVQLLSVNDHGIAAGYWQDNLGDQHGLLYDFATNKYTFVNDDPEAVPVGGITIEQVTGINNAGEITGFYIGADAVAHGFVATSVPEPTSLALMGVGLTSVVAVGYARRRRQTISA
jgi:probable HAF family extracellular repeat protein